MRSIKDMEICCYITKNDIYDATEKERYSLGLKGEKTLFCIGINPSTACPNNYDNTINKLKKIAEENGYDSWIMLNIYPQRATDPDNLDKEYDKIIHEKNLQIIDQYIKDGSKILCSWGVLINKRTYLINCLRDIYKLLNKKKNISFFHIDKLTKDGHPRHILFAETKNGLEVFDLNDYINKF
jgi:hypothetical protein